MKGWFKSGSPWVWLSAAAVSVCILLVVALLGLIAARGLVFFWPKQVLQAHYQDPSGGSYRLIGEIQDAEEIPAGRLRESGIELPGDEDSYTRYLIKTGNRDTLGMDFRSVLPDFMEKVEYPAGLMVVERREWGNLYGYLKEVRENGQTVAQGDSAAAELQRRLERALELFGRIRHIEKDLIGSINYQLEQLRLEERRLDLGGDHDPASRAAIEARRKDLQDRYEELQKERNDLFPQLNRDSFTAEIMTGQLVEVPLAKVVRFYFPNAMGPLDKIGHYFGKLWEFVSDEPREANTEGGIFPAIFGTVMMVLLMSVLVTPCGVVAAVYLREYARQGLIVRLIRIAVNNLAGVPSIVYGVFGLGFFVYFLGGNIDALFYPEALPSPTFGTPGILWSSITLALLTLPVVIVATEEGLARVPRSIREGSLALGATKAETLWRTVLPMASPGMMTGLILAVARAAGEVAPLMLVGVVKLAPSLPLDGNPPFLHLDRKFMHLGFHIYDVGFQSPNVEAARPLVYATSLLLILVIVVLNLTAIRIRNHLREKYRSLES
ncbi:MAG TPA: phosphate ABC transporter permease PstA [Gammaproteobacteria bacterium]|nr:phosphate ABC transporter permease PstA [Gammaproteobacteria bacterium]